MVHCAVSSSALQARFLEQILPTVQRVAKSSARTVRAADQELFVGMTIGNSWVIYCKWAEEGAQTSAAAIAYLARSEARRQLGQRKRRPLCGYGARTVEINPQRLTQVSEQERISCRHYPIRLEADCMVGKDGGE